VDYLFIALGLYLAFRLGQASIIALLKDEVRERMLGVESANVAVKAIIDTDEAAEHCEFKLERVHNHYYAYAVSGEFLAQGPDFGSLFSAIKQRFPQRTFKVNPKGAELSEAECQELIRAVVATFGDKK
jgi:hypothetical protein